MTLTSIIILQQLVLALRSLIRRILHQFWNLPLYAQHLWSNIWNIHYLNILTDADSGYGKLLQSVFGSCPGTGSNLCWWHTSRFIIIIMYFSSNTTFSDKITTIILGSCDGDSGGPLVNNIFPWYDFFFLNIKCRWNDSFWIADDRIAYCAWPEIFCHRNCSIRFEKLWGLPSWISCIYEYCQVFALDTGDYPGFISSTEIYGFMRNVRIDKTSTEINEYIWIEYWLVHMHAFKFVFIYSLHSHVSGATNPIVVGSNHSSNTMQFIMYWL